MIQIIAAWRPDFAVTAEAVEAARMRIGGEAAVEDVVLGDALGGERHFCEQGEVAHQAVAFALREGAVGFGETGEHRLANVRADLEGLGTDARASQATKPVLSGRVRA